MFAFVTVVFFAASAVAQVPQVGRCPQVQTKSDIDVTKYVGKWYEQEKYFAFFELGGKCITAEYQPISDNMISVLNKQTNMNGKVSSIQGTAEASAADPSKLTVRFPSVPVPAPYWVLDTDYENYAVVWSCTDLFVFSAKTAWILTRDRNPSPEIMAQARAVYERNGIDTSFLLKTDQTNCPSDD